MNMTPLFTDTPTTLADARGPGVVVRPRAGAGDVLGLAITHERRSRTT